MAKSVAAAIAVVFLSACGSASAAMTQYRSPAGYTLSYPSGWTVKASAQRTFSAVAPGGNHYVVVILLDQTPDQLVDLHRIQLERVSSRTELREAQTGSGTAPELWSSRTERDGRAGIYQQYFVATSKGTLWIQHGWFRARTGAHRGS